jgi:hypothetical protein
VTPEVFSLFLLAVFSSVTLGTAANAISTDERQSASRACMLAIKQRLHDASSAEFLDPSETAVAVKKGIFIVQHQARVRNGFGAMQLATFECRMSKQGDQWLFHSIRQLLVLQAARGGVYNSRFEYPPT